MLSKSITYSLVIIMASHSAKKDNFIKPDQMSFLFVNLNQEFPVILMRLEADGYLSGQKTFINRFGDQKMLVSRTIA